MLCRSIKGEKVVGGWKLSTDGDSCSSQRLSIAVHVDQS